MDTPAAIVNKGVDGFFRLKHIRCLFCIDASIVHKNIWMITMDKVDLIF